MAFLEHRRLENAALELRSATLNACVVAAGIPYGLGEGPLLRMFRQAWLRSESPIGIPSYFEGENRLGLIHVRDLSAIIESLLVPTRHDGLPASFPKPYILAVDSDDAQPTLKEVAATISRAFGGTGETQLMGSEEVQDFYLDNVSELSLQLNVGFSTKGGLLESMEAEGESCTSQTLAAKSLPASSRISKSSHDRTHSKFCSRNIAY